MRDGSGLYVRESHSAQESSYCTWPAMFFQLFCDDLCDHAQEPCPLLESVFGRWLAQCLPDNLDLLRSQYAPCARRFSVRYVVQSALVHPPKPLPHGRVRPHQQISYPAYARVDLPLVACSQDVPYLPRWAGRNHLQENLCVCIGQEIIACWQGTGFAPSASV